MKLPDNLFDSYQEALIAGQTADTETQQVERFVAEQDLSSPESMDWAAQVGAFVTKKARELDDVRKSAKAPWLSAARAVDDRFMPAIKRLKRVKDVLASRVKAAEEKQLRLHAAAMQSAQTPQQVQAAVAVLAPAPESVTHRTSWVLGASDGQPLPLTLADAKARGLPIPDDCWILDTARLAKLAREKKGAFAVAGLCAKPEKKVVFK